MRRWMMPSPLDGENHTGSMDACSVFASRKLLLQLDFWELMKMCFVLSFQGNMLNHKNLLSSIKVRGSQAGKTKALCWGTVSWFRVCLEPLSILRKDIALILPSLQKIFLRHWCPYSFKCFRSPLFLCVTVFLTEPVTN